MLSVKVKRNKKMDLEKVLRELRGPTKVKVGFPKGKADQDNINKAVWNEFGTEGGASGGGWGGPIPERPFMRNAMRNNEHGLRSVIGMSSAKLLRGETDLDTVLKKLGIYFQGKMQSEIMALSTPPNSPTTIALKGSSNPLIDSGEMRQAVTWKIDNE